MRLVLLALLCCAVVCTAAAGECLPQMKSWIEKQKSLYPTDRPSDPDKMLYFLHVPRTAGRTTHNCFLLPSTPPSRRCAKSYDGLKYDISLPDCGLIASHDDFSAMASLPSSAAVFTSIRDPVSRFLSAYEFAVELGGRDAVRNTPGRAPDKKQGKTSTKEVWPWSHLQPIMLEDMTPKVHAQRPGEKGVWKIMYTEDGELYYLNRVQNVTEWEVPEDEKHLIVEDQGPLRPYDNVLYMPLREFSEHPDSFELLHNGQTLQVLGLTNYSHDPEASVLRNCIINDKASAKAALIYAIERLQTFAFVGTFETMRESLPSWANMRGIDLDSKAWSSNKQHAFSYDDGDDNDEGKDKEFLDPELPQDEKQLTTRIKAVGKEVSDMRRELETLVVDSPEHVELKDRIDVQADLRDRLINQRTNVQAGTKIVSRLTATGRARQLVPDEEHIVNKTIIEQFATCEQNAQQRSASKRKGSMNRIKRLDGVSPQFSKKSRERIPAAVIARIKELNWMDVELHEVATEMATSMIKKARANGMTPLPKRAPPSAKDSGSATPSSSRESASDGSASDTSSTASDSTRDEL